VAIAARPQTKNRLITAASALFAERGFGATTVRDIAARAGANVAAGNYHYGSKKALYLEVLRAQFAEIQAVLRHRRAAPSSEQLARLRRTELEELLRSRTKAMLDLLLGPPPGVHGMLMQREMCDPSEALPVIVEEFITPRMVEMRAIIAHLEPGLGPAAVDRCVFSIIGQVVFYRFMMPALLLILCLESYPRGFTRQLAEHITTFSLGGMDRIVGRGRRRRGR